MKGQRSKMQGETPTPPHARWLALSGLWLAYTAFGATAASLAPLLPEIRADIETSNTTLGLILGAWPLVYIVMAIPAGALLDAIGARTGIFIATLVIAASAALRGWAPGAGEMLLAVALFGVGGPLISVGAPKLIAAMFEGPGRGAAIGIYMTGPNVGSVLTLMLTSDVLLPLAGGWRGVMMFHAGFALLSGLVWLGAAALARVSANAPARERFDPGALRAMLRQADILMVLALAVGIFYINHALINWLPAILRADGMSASEAGLWASVPTLVGLVTALTVPRLASEARRLPMLIGLTGLACAASLLIVAGQGQGLAAGLVLQGIVRGAMNPIAILILVELPGLPKNRIGLAGGVFFAAGEIGGVLGPFSFGLLRDATGGFPAPLYSLTIVSLAMAALAVMLLRRSRA